MFIYKEINGWFQSQGILPALAFYTKVVKCLSRDLRWLCVLPRWRINVNVKRQYKFVKIRLPVFTVSCFAVNKKAQFVKTCNADRRC